MSGADTVDAGEFFRLAEYLERLTNDGLTRVDRRVRIAGEVAAATQDRTQWYTGDDARAFAGALGRTHDEARRAEPACGDAYRALQKLAAEARRVGQIVQEAQQYEKSWNQQVVANWSEWQDRTTTAVADAIGLGEDGASAELTARYQELTRQTEAASEQRRVALQQWRDACTVARTKLSVATDTLAPLLLTTDQALVQPERSYNKDSARDHVRLAWYESIEQKLKAGTDHATIEAWWRGLTDDERTALMKDRGDLIEIFLWGVLSADERLTYETMDTHPLSETERMFEVEVTLPIGPASVRLLARTSVKEVQTSDHRSEVTIDLSAEGAAGGGLKFLGFDLGNTERLVLTNSFSSSDVARQVVDEVNGAMQADRALGDTSMSRTRAVLARHFSFDAERATGKVAQLVGAGGVGASIGVKERLLAGTYARSDGKQTGVFLQASIEAVADSPHVQATAQATVDGKLYVDDDDRRFLELSYKGDVSGSVNPDSPYKVLVDQVIARSDLLRDMNLPDSGLKSAGLTFKVEATDGNRDLITGMLQDLSLRQIDKDKALALLDRSDVVFSTATGTQVILRPPANPFLGGQVSTREVTVDDTFRKPPNGQFYPQGPR